MNTWQLPRRSREPNEYDETPFNIIPVHDLLSDHRSLRFPEVRAAIAALRAVEGLHKPPFVLWQPNYDLLDWLGAFFGFQDANVSNQREHLVLHLANAQMRQQPPPDNVDTLDPSVLRRFRCKLLSNYSHWCSFIGRKSNIWIFDTGRGYYASDHRRELLYVALYLLIWGESANLRFMPECICYIFHHMAMELNRILEDCIDENTGRPVSPSISGENAFLNRIVTPIYETVKAEVDNSRNRNEPYSNWRNYDDFNEFFWSRSCFDDLKWPIDIGSNFFVKTRKGKRASKTGFVEQRSFLNLFRSFDKLWTMLILFLQAAIIVAWKGQNDIPLHALGDKDIQVKVLTVFITWSVLKFVQSLLDARMQYKLVSLKTLWLGVRMVLKVVISAAWVYVLVVFYAKIWNQKNHDRRWSAAANQRVATFLKFSLVFVIPELLALALFFLPWIHDFLENTNWRIFYIIRWWFQTRSFVGCGLREGLGDKIKYSLFWIFVLSTKFCFSYFLQIKPMIRPTKDLLDLRDVTYEWHMFFENKNRFAVGLLWLPVILIYLMDLQIWYSIYSSIVGMAVGLFNHLGEIRNIRQLRFRFESFVSALQFNLMPEEQMSNSRMNLNSKFKDVHRLKLRYGFGRPFKKLEPNQLEAHKFALVWNEIILTFREEDIVSDHEVELLELPQNSWNIRVIRWPCFLLCNELLLALAQAKEMVDYPDKRVWYKMAKNEYRRCAVIEAYDSIKHLVLTIVKINTPEHAIFTNLFQEIENSINIEKFTKTFNMRVLRKIHSKVITLLNLLLSPYKDVHVTQIMDTIMALYEISTRDFFKDKRSMKQLQEDGLAPHGPHPGAGLLFENAVELPDSDDENFYRQVRRLHMILTSRGAMNNVPMNLEARRRITFFSNSMFMNMPRAPQVENMMAFSVLTPYYSEEVVYSKEKLRRENDDGVSILNYLQTIYPDEWDNFLERMKREGMESEMELWRIKLRELRLWASYRSQTLARTVRGMMYYYRALELLTFLDSASEINNREGVLGDSRVGTLFQGHEYITVLMKYTYVVACQIYGRQNSRKDPHADEILYLMKNNEALRVAYVDEVHAWDRTDYYSVLVKYDRILQKEVEIYRVKLPGRINLGEGKSENQNHAIIFTRGEAVQTIDMNQDNYFEEALKIRNLLEEYQRYNGIHKPTVLGVQENIFTGSVSSMARFMSAHEMSFVTLCQRVFANPLKIRLHYGHPDVFDRFWFLTRGGLSKASRLINLSGCIFAGFSCTLRGGNVTHHEYIRVGKGLDIDAGLNQVSLFEAKVASGNGQQVLSRDVYRLGHRLNFFRMLSFYFTTIGYFFSTLMVLLTVYTFLWGRLYFALKGVENSVYELTNTNLALGTVLKQQFIVQLGLLTVLPMIIENSLELGFLSAIWDFITMQLQLSPVFFTFSLVTRAHYFGRTILHGVEKFRATGRGFVVQHKTFADNYRIYARSHFVKAVELGLILTVYTTYSPVAKGTFNYIALTVSSWFLVFSLIMAPFIFNPSGFDWFKLVYDYDDFMKWIWLRAGVFTRPEESWEIWWYQEQDHLLTTGFLGKLFEIILDLRFFFFQYGIVYQLGIAGGSKSIAVYLLSWIYIAVALGIYSIITYARDKYAAKAHIYYRLIQVLVIVIGMLIIIGLKVFTHFKFLDLLTSLFAFIPTGWGLILIGQVFQPVLKRTCIWEIVVSMARAYDMMFGMIILTPVAFLSWMPGFQLMQTRILFNHAFSRSLGISKVIMLCSREETP